MSGKAPKTMGILFTRFATGVGVADPLMVAPHTLVMMGLARKHGGIVARLEARGCQAVFDGPGQAILCAFAVRARLAEQNRALRPGKRVSASFAVHRGDAVLKEDAVEGQGAEFAARLLAATPGGRVFCSQGACEVLLGRLACGFLPLGRQCLSGLPEPIDLYEVVAVPALDPKGTTSGARRRSTRGPAWR